MSRPVYALLGFLCVGLGYIGFVLPVMPGTVFFILALNFFRRSSPRLESWLLTRPTIGPMLKEWDETGAIRPRVKRIILFVMWGSMIGSSMTVYRKFPDLGTRLTLWGVLLACGVGVSWYVLSRPSDPTVRKP